MQFIVFVILLAVMLQQCHGLSADQLAAQCFQKWYHVKQGSKTDDQEQCARLKIVVDCWAKETVDRNALLDQSRFFTEQEAILSNILGICIPPIDVTKLTKAVETSGLKDKYRSVIVDNDKPAKCAADAYRTCLHQYDKLFTNGKMCKDATTFIACIKDKAKSCKAEIFQHFSRIFDQGLGEEFTGTDSKIPSLCNRL